MWGVCLKWNLRFGLGKRVDVAPEAGRLLDSQVPLFLRYGQLKEPGVARALLVKCIFSKCTATSLKNVGHIQRFNTDTLIDEIIHIVTRSFPRTNVSLQLNETRLKF